MSTLQTNKQKKTPMCSNMNTRIMGDLQDTFQCEIERTFVASIKTFPEAKSLHLAEESFLNDVLY